MNDDLSLTLHYPSESLIVAEPLQRWEKVALILATVGWVAFGGVVVLRSALQNERKTDFGVYARAAWAIRAGEPLYGVCDDRGWHYCYPPPFALFMTPLADPPGWLPRDGYLPFAASCAIWYVLSLGLLAYTLHTFANLVLPNEPRWSRRWWYARTMPAWVCVGAIGMTLSRGQVNLLLVWLLAAMFAAAMRSRTTTSGVWLAAAICLKVIPGVLVAFPFLRREWRAGLGLTAGMVLGLGVIPIALWGVGGAIDANQTFLRVVAKPGATGTGDQSRAKELTDGTTTDSQSFLAVIHNWRHPDPMTRPTGADRNTRLAHWVMSGLMFLATLLLGRRASAATSDQLIVFGSLCVVMLMATPVSHMHYLVMALPLVAGLWLKEMAARPDKIWATPRTTAMLFTWGLLTAVPLFPYAVTTWMRDMGVAPALTLGLWGYGLAMLGESAKAEVIAEETPAAKPLRRAA